MIFHTDRDQHLLDFDRTLFLGHSPAELLHGLLGTDLAARPLAFFYEVFVYVVVAAVVGSVALLPRVKDSYVMLFAGVWVWILGVGSYYLVPSLAPFASAAEEFASLRPTGVTACARAIVQMPHNTNGSPHTNGIRLPSTFRSVVQTSPVATGR